MDVFASSSQSFRKQRRPCSPEVVGSRAAVGVGGTCRGRSRGRRRACRDTRAVGRRLRPRPGSSPGARSYRPGPLLGRNGQDLRSRWGSAMAWESAEVREFVLEVAGGDGVQATVPDRSEHA